jgi:hypothetical protein
MIQSVEPRITGTPNFRSGDTIVEVSSNNPEANRINGHETDHSAFEAGAQNSELQNACIMQLLEPIVCDEGDPLCDCAFEPARNRAICQPQFGGQPTTTQYAVGAKPSSRILGVMREAKGAAPDSICAPSDRVLESKGALLQALVEKTREGGAGRCFEPTLASG